MKDKQTVLVTGGAGYIGSHICKSLHKSGFVPLSLDNLSKGHQSAVKWGPSETGDIGDAALLDRIIAQYKPMAAIHCAALTDVGESVAQPSLYYHNNVQGSLVLLDALRRGGVELFIFSSSCATYGRVKQLPILESTPQWPISPYGWSKLMVERMVTDFQEAYGMRYAFLRYFNAAGADPEGEIGEQHNPETHLIPLLFHAALGRIPHFRLFGDQHPTPDGTPIRDYIHVTDLADAHVKALTKLIETRENLALNLGSGTGYSVKQVIDAAERICGGKIPVRTEAPRPGDPPVLVADIQAARQALNWAPRYSDLDTILNTAWAWEKIHH